MRGDYLEVLVRTVTGNERIRTTASGVGGSVDLDMPRSADSFITIYENNKAGKAIRTNRFNKSDVVAVLFGHEERSVRKPKAKA